MVVDYEVAKCLNEVGFHCKSFWVYIDGKRTYTGFDGFDEGNFNFLEDNYLDPVVAKDYQKLLINKQFTDEAYPQKKPEILCCPESEDVIYWLETFGVYISFNKKDSDSWSTSVSGKNVSTIKTHRSRMDATKEAILDGIVILKRELKK
jgi:hypothetical protein